MAITYLGLGSNLGDREKNIEEALRRLKAEGAATILAVSSFYETEPVGGPKQGKYINGAAKAVTRLDPKELLNALKKIEEAIGRKSAPKDHAREIDLDILLYDDLVLKADGIEIPHPRMHERAFVLKGMSEIAQDVVHPILRKTMRELYAEVKH
jgi:2-amino-4-hydroxy-6-hydroxymethyldihydropteridine diphosphokinase